MRNIELYNCSVNKIPNEKGPVLDALYDTDTNRLFFVQNHSLRIYYGSEVQILCPIGSGDIKNVSLSYLDDLSTVCLTYTENQDGNVLLYNMNTDIAEIVGTVDGGIICSKWSPDMEILLIVTMETRKLFLMNRDFDLIKETEVFLEEFGEGAPVTVGWGKKETQFHGSAGKQARDVKVQVHHSLIGWDDRLPRVTWRGDGKYFAVSVVDPVKEVRILKIFDRDGQLQYTSEFAPFLDAPISWKPSGALIAAPQQTPTGYQISFFETNGLRHGEFGLEPHLQVCDIKWNNESNILSLYCQRKVNDHLQFCVQLWVSSNYHWYLKQELNYDKGVSIDTFFWDSVKPFRLHVVLSTGEYIQYNFRFSVIKSYGLDVKDLANVYVVDGAKALVTPFRTMAVPPPMCAYSVELPNTPVLMAPSYSDPNSFLTLQQDGNIKVFNIVDEEEKGERLQIDGAGGIGFKRKCSLHSLVLSSKINLDGIVTGGIYLQPNLILFISNLSGQFVSRYSISPESASENVSPIQLPSLIETYSVASPEEVILLTEDKQLLKLSVIDMKLEKLDLLSGLVVASRISTKMAVSTISSHDYIFVLTDGGHLYLDGKVIFSGVTGFELTSGFLLMTTFEHTLRALPLNKTSLDIALQGKLSPIDESLRRIERGSRLVVCVPFDTKVILQMPRGNLEAIHPRVLVIEAVAKSLQNSDYHSAFVTMRRHRINLNFLVDHDPEKFIGEMDMFVEKIPEQSWLCQFITDLQGEDVSYAEFSSQMSKKTWTPNKVDYICSELRKIFERRSIQNYILPILTCYVKMTKPDYDGALRLILELRRKEEEEPTAPRLFLESLKYLLVLVDVETLYRSSLGTYDLNLALLVAENSQKDPKEFLPFLQDLERKDENDRRYTIDIFLCRYDRAVQALAKCGPSRFEQLKELVMKHNLYLEALICFEDKIEEKKVISCMFADHLLGSRKVYEAGSFYYRGEAFQEALNCFRKTLDWKMAIVCGKKLCYSESEMSKLYKELAQLLTNSKNPCDGARIYKEYLRDFSSALTACVENALWEDALFCTLDMDVNAEIRLKDGVVAGAKSMELMISNLESSFITSYKRLENVRKENAERESRLAYGEEVENPLDLASEAGSTITGTMTSGSRYTGSSRSIRSSKNKRKLERKLYSTKEGSPYEDLGLVVALHEMMVKAYDLRGETRGLLKVLLHFELESIAQDVQTSLENLLNLMERQSRCIWTAVKAEDEENVFGPEATVAQIVSMGVKKFDRLNLLEPHLRHPPVKPEIKWKISLV
ncbi:elongator complex protein 1-like isoform X1 [Artemia franciscana]